MAFEVGIGGNIDGLKKSFKEAADASVKFEKSVVASGVKAEAAIAAVGKGGVTMGKFSAQSSQASFAVTNLNRVVQDAPFGFIAIQNNLNPLIESFQQLRKESGSNAGALKSLVGSLAGPAGVGLAIAAVSAGILLYQQQAQKAAKETKALSDATDALAESAAGEIAKLTVLYDATQNLNIPLSQRKIIVDELQKQYPTTFGNLKDEAILAGKAQAAYEGLTQSLINNAIVKGGEDLISAKVKGLAASLIQFEDAQRKLSDKTGGKGFLAKNNSFNVDENGDLEAVNDYETRIKKEIADVRKSVQGALGNFSAADIIGNFSEAPGKTKKVAEGATKQELLQELDDLAAEMLIKYKGFWIEIANQPMEQLSRSLKQTKEQVAKELRSGEPLIPIANVFGKIDAPAAGAELYTPFEILKDEIDFDLLPAIGDSFENFFQDILEKGEFSFKSLGASIKKTFASVLANEATQELLNALGQKGKAAEGKGGLIPALLGVLKGGGKSSAGSLASVAASTGGSFIGSGVPVAASTAKSGAGILGGIGPAGLALGGALIAKSLIDNIVEGINKKRDLPNLYGPDGSSFIGESRTRGNDLLQTWYRTNKRKGR